MLAQIDTVHDDITSALKAKIKEVFNILDNIIAEKQKECEKGSVPNSGPAFDTFIRGIRKKHLLN